MSAANEIFGNYLRKPAPVLAVIEKDGTINTFGVPLDATIAALWAQHADAPNEVTSGFYAAMALLEVRALAARGADTPATQEADE